MKFRVTKYSYGTEVNGPDNYNDKWTNKGYTSTGQNLTFGIVAVAHKMTLGSIFKDNDTNEFFIAADLHGNEDKSVIDIFWPIEKYNSPAANQEFRNLSVVEKIDIKAIPKTPEGIRKLLDTFAQPKTSFIHKIKTWWHNR